MHSGLLYINGAFAPASTGDTFPVTNPSNLEVIGHQAAASSADIAIAIEGAVVAFRTFSKTSAYDRAKSLRTLHGLMIDHQRQLAETMTLEQGKPLHEALVEVNYAASYVQWYAEEALRIQGDILQSHMPQVKMHVLKEPIGPVGIITPWNFPLAMFVRKLAPALAAGCTVVVKPAEQTPFTAVKFFELIHACGFEPGVCQLITGDAPTIGAAMMQHPGIAKVSFTGSTEVGQLLASQSGQTLKKLSLELGGHAPLIVFDDAKLEMAVQGTLDSKFRNCGQVCIATNRVLVQRGILDQYVEALKASVSKLTTGDGFSGADLGPLIDAQGYKKVERHVADAMKRGAKLVVGGQGLPNQGGFFYAPTILSDVTGDMLIFNEETFGPIVPICVFDTEAEALSIANGTPFGLAAYVFTESLGRAHRVSEGLQFGMVGVNTGRISAAQAPFGGVKMSGYGREGGHYGIEDYLVTKYVAFGI